MLDSGLLVGKVSLVERRQVVVDRLVEHRRVWEHGVPVPRLLAFTSGSEAVCDCSLIVSEYLPGRDADEASHSLPDTMMVDAMRATGSAVARLHQVPVDAFGDPVTGLGVGPDSWSAVVAGRVELLRRAYRDVDGVAAGLVSAGLALLGRLANEVSPVVRPAVAHLDVYLPNLLLDDEERFSVLLARRQVTLQEIFDEVERDPAPSSAPLEATTALVREVRERSARW